MLHIESLTRHLRRRSRRWLPSGEMRGGGVVARLLLYALHRLPPDVKREIELMGRDHALRTEPTGRYLVGHHSHSRPPILIDSWGAEAKVRVGNYTSINPTAVFFLGGIHRTDWVTTFRLRPIFGIGDKWLDGSSITKGDICVGSDVWIAQGAAVMSGVSIEHGAVVAAYAVVTRNVEPFEMVAGVPARHVRFRFDEETRKALLRIAWWEWPDDKVRAHVDELCSTDVAAFIAAHDPERKPTE